MILVLIVDDHAVVREGLKALIGGQPDMEVMGEADNGPEALEMCQRFRPAVAVVDVSMPGMNGAEVAKRLKESCPQVKVLALTVHEDISYLRQLLEAGAAGYVLKRAAADELIHAIRVVADGGVFLDPLLAGKMVSDYLEQEHAGARGEPGDSLSEREREVLRQLAWGYSNKEIAHQLKISIKTVETYKVRLMEKLNLHSRVDIVRYALQQGWLQSI